MARKGEQGQYDMAAVLWVGWERRYFNSFTGKTDSGTNIYREIWRQIDGMPKKSVTETKIPQIAETYYAAVSQIDKYIRCRQQNVQLEKIPGS